jgi:hypothetical protein
VEEGEGDGQGAGEIDPWFTACSFEASARGMAMGLLLHRGAAAMEPEARRQLRKTMESMIQRVGEAEGTLVVLTLPLVGPRKAHRSRSTRAAISVWGDA